jgi:hypothetical protein
MQKKIWWSRRYIQSKQQNFTIFCFNRRMVVNPCKLCDPLLATFKRKRAYLIVKTECYKD